jgi:hypothetical protein
MSYQGKKSIPHITVSGPRPTPLRFFVAWRWSPSGSTSTGWGDHRGTPEASCVAAGGAGPVSPWLPPPPSL